MSTNVVVLTGNLGKTPIVNQADNGIFYCRFSVAQNEAYRSDGMRVEHTNWVQVVAFKELAKTLALLEAGDKVTVVGRLHVSEFEKEGVRRQVTQIRAQSVHFLSVKAWDRTADRVEDDPPADEGTEDLALLVDDEEERLPGA